MPHDQHEPHPEINMTFYEDNYEDHVEEDRSHAGASVEMVWKGLVVLAGIYVFFVTERLISLGRAARRHSNEVLLIYNNSVVLFRLSLISHVYIEFTFVSILH